VAKTKDLGGFEDYCPVGILPALSKALELVMRDQLVMSVDLFRNFNLVSSQAIAQPLHSSKLLMTFQWNWNANSLPYWSFLISQRLLTLSVMIYFAESCSLFISLILLFGVSGLT
jgi:hypothetical protein